MIHSDLDLSTPNVLREFSDVHDLSPLPSNRALKLLQPGASNQKSGGKPNGGKKQMAMSLTPALTSLADDGFGISLKVISSQPATPLSPSPVALNVAKLPAGTLFDDDLTPRSITPPEEDAELQPEQSTTEPPQIAASFDELFANAARDEKLAAKRAVDEAAAVAAAQEKTYAIAAATVAVVEARQTMETAITRVLSREATRLLAREQAASPGAIILEQDAIVSVADAEAAELSNMVALNSLQGYESVLREESAASLAALRLEVDVSDDDSEDDNDDEEEAAEEEAADEAEQQKLYELLVDAHASRLVDAPAHAFNARGEPPTASDIIDILVAAVLLVLCVCLTALVSAAVFSPAPLAALTAAWGPAEPTIEVEVAEAPLAILAVAKVTKAAGGPLAGLGRHWLKLLNRKTKAQVAAIRAAPTLAHAIEMGVQLGAPVGFF